MYVNRQNVPRSSRAVSGAALAPSVTVDLKPSQYEAALRLIRSTEEALDHLAACTRRKEEAARLRRGIQEVEALLKKLKQELRLG